MKDFFGELSRRNVFRVGLTYLVVGWFVVQIVNNLVPLMAAPDWVGKVVLILLIAGFPVALVLAWANELTPEGIKRDAGPTEVPARSHGFGRKWDFVIIAGLVIALGYSLRGRFSTPPAKSPPGTITLAVLPFEDLSPNRDQGYFADGIAEQLLDSLSRVKGLQVTARTSSFYFKGKNEDMRTIGRALNVENLLEGSVRKEGNEVRITTQLINAETGYHLWSETYDKKLTDIFAVQDDIANEVAGALNVALGVAATKLPGMTRNVDAYDEYLKAQALANQYTPESVQKAVEHFERAVVLDPSFAVAWSDMAECYNRGGALVPEKAAAWRKRFLEAVEQAHKVAPEAPYVLLSTADTEILQGRFKEGGAIMESFRKVAAKYGLENDTRVSGGDFLSDVGRARDAVTAIERVKAASPLDTDVALRLGEAYADAGRTADALAEFDRGLKLDAGDELVLEWGALLTALTTGDRAQIDQRLAAVEQRHGFASDIHISMGRFLDDPTAARKDIREHAEDFAKQDGPFAYSLLADWAAYYGAPDLALEYLRKSYESGLTVGLVALTLWRPILHDVRKLPGFKDLVTKMGLVDYWRAYGWADDCHPVGDNDFECT